MKLANNMNLLRIAVEKAGYRERFAMEHGNKNVRVLDNGNLGWVYTYSKTNPYQDANGATFDCVRKEWVA